MSTKKSNIEVKLNEKIISEKIYQIKFKATVIPQEGVKTRFNSITATGLFVSKRLTKVDEKCIEFLKPEYENKYNVKLEFQIISVKRVPDSFICLESTKTAHIKI